MSGTSETDGRADQPTSVPPEPTSPVPPRAETAPAGARGALEAARALAAFAPRLGWGLLIVGLLAGLGRALDSAATFGPTVSGRIVAVAAGASLILGFGLAGWALALLCSAAAAFVIEHLARSGSDARELIAELRRVRDVLERWTEAGGRPSEPAQFAEIAAIDRARRVADIDRATRSESWEEAERLIGAFQLAFPGDPDLAAMREKLDAGRREAILAKLAQLDAARQVNDPARVIELYTGIAASLEPERRGTLERDLARWFLDVIHRRLRTGKIQPDVVALATQVAETFATTVEGASMRAALPTLRRSVGLCPRCAQPYWGTGNACPACLGATFGLSAGPPPAAPEGPS